MSDNTAVIEGWEPGAVWQAFAGLADTPRPSKHEEQAREYVRRWAGERGFAVQEDGVGNLVVAVPATAGHESAPITVLQGHLDMVPEKVADLTHDFACDPITLVSDQDAADGSHILRADRTTLGADNGIGVSLAMAAATSPEVAHGPLELLFTIDEEDGMTGAKALTSRSFSGRRLINLDSEEDDCLYIGCAGGCDSVLSWSLPTESAAPRQAAIRISVDGLRGGHSGGDIHLSLGNAIRLLARVIDATADVRLQLASIQAGAKRNVIPRTATAVVVGPVAAVAAVQSAAAAVLADAVKTYSDEDRECTIAVEPIDDVPRTVIGPGDTASLVQTILALPHGVIGMHPDIAELVETSNNVATIRVVPGSDDDSCDIELATLTRSSSEFEMQKALSEIERIALQAGARVRRGNDYPGWAPDVNSPLLAICKDVYDRLFDGPPEIKAIHAGLECGLIGKCVGDVDMVSFGPRIEMAHTPEERVYVDSVGKIWRYLQAVLAALATG